MGEVDRDCIVCGREFFIKADDVSFFEKKNLELPKRCWDCRKNKQHHKYKVARNAVRRHKNFLTYEEFFLNDE